MILRLAMGGIVAVYFIVIFWLLKHGKFALSYSLLWLFSGCIMALFVIFPNMLEYMARCLGIEVASNGLFAMSIFLIIIILTSMTVIVSKLSSDLRKLVQNCAIMEKRLRYLEAKNEEKE